MALALREGEVVGGARRVLDLTMTESKQGQLKQTAEKIDDKIWWREALQKGMHAVDVEQGSPRSTSW